MPIKLFNALTRKKEIFRPKHAGRVTFYACGPTVYGFVHIGNFRTYIFEDLLHRALILAGLKVKKVMNITDVDDKTIRDSKASGEGLKDFTERYTKEFFSDIEKLNILPASKYAKATEHVPDMVKMIRNLVKKKLAYETDDGVYFDISKFKNYGRLSRVKKRELKIGARVNSDEYDKDQAKDFVLWKKKRGDEPWWPSSFGAGRPGWHIECSAMSVKYLGMPIDIHAGGVDLIFPHHENEIAQSEGARGDKFARFFIEGEMMSVEGHKMSKSLKNTFTLRDMAERGFSPLDFRYLTLTAHYRSPLSFSWRSLEAASSARLNMERRALELKAEGGKLLSGEFKKAFAAKINNDLNIPGALDLVWRLLKSGKATYNNLIFADRVFGLGISALEKLKIPARVEELVNKREEYRRAHDWLQADRLRDEIKALGFEVSDSEQGPRVFKSQLSNK